MAKNHIDRTVQYWRIVDGHTGNRLAEEDWQRLLRALQAEPRSFAIDGRSHAGGVHQMSVVSDWEEALSLDDVPGAVVPENGATTFGIVLAADKDYVPNQRHSVTGAQNPMRLDGEDWEPVDNLFVWFLPFGNFIGVLAESTASTRARKFAEWLTRAVIALGGDLDTSYDVQAVIDPTRAAMLAHADGLKSIVYAGEIGTAVADASGLRSLFVGPTKDVRAIRLEVRATLVRGKSDPHTDEQALLEWYNTTFGPLDGRVSKAQVTMTAADEPPTEIDLLEHRLTRKKTITIAPGPTRSFTALTALGAIVDAFVLDRADLLRLRANED